MSVASLFTRLFMNATSPALVVALTGSMKFLPDSGAAWLASSAASTLATRLGYLLARGAFRALSDKMDPRKSNGGVFLGLNGVVIKSHGGADAEGTASAIDMGYDMVRYELLAKIGQSMARDLQAGETARLASGASP